MTVPSVLILYGLCLHCTVYSIDCTLYSAEYICVLHTQILYTLHRTVYNMDCTLYSAEYIYVLHTHVYSTLYSVQYELYSIHIYTELFMKLPLL
jgi:hypothetical protein